MTLDRRSFLAALGLAAPAAKAAEKAAIKPPVTPKAPERVAICTRTVPRWDDLGGRSSTRVEAYSPLPHQQAVLDCPKREILLTGGRGSGMTTTCRMWVKSRDLLVTTHPRDFREIYGDHEFEVTEIKYVWFVPGWDGMPRHCDGTTRRIAIDMNCDDVMEDEYLRLRDKCGQILLATVPSLRDGSRHWVYRRFLAHPHPDRAVIHATVRDNPYLVNSPIARECERLVGQDRSPAITGRWL